MMKTAIRLITAALLLSLTAPARANDHEKILPYLADDVVATAYVDLTKLDLPACVRQMSELGVVPASDAKPALSAARPRSR